MLDLGTLVDAIHVASGAHLELLRLHIPNSGNRQVKRPSERVRLNVAGAFALWPSVTVARDSKVIGHSRFIPLCSCKLCPPLLRAILSAVMQSEKVQSAGGPGRRWVVCKYQEYFASIPMQPSVRLPSKDLPLLRFLGPLHAGEHDSAKLRSTPEKKVKLSRGGVRAQMSFQDCLCTFYRNSN